MTKGEFFDQPFYDKTHPLLSPSPYRVTRFDPFCFYSPLAVVLSQEKEEEE